MVTSGHDCEWLCGREGFLSALIPPKLCGPGQIGRIYVHGSQVVKNGDFLYTLPSGPPCFEILVVPGSGSVCHHGCERGIAASLPSRYCRTLG